MLCTSVCTRVVCGVMLGFVSAAERGASSLAGWHDGDDKNSLLGTDGRSLVQLLLRLSSGSAVFTSSVLLLIAEVSFIISSPS